MNRTYIIAEAGVNHNGSIDLALEMISKAKSIGVDCIKFQTFKTNKIVTKTSPKANYQMNATNPRESQFEMLKKLELSKDDYLKIIKSCKDHKIDFMSTPYSFEDIDFLDQLGVKSFKIASGQLTELPFLKCVASKKKEIFLSTGMSYFSEVLKAVETIKSISDAPLTIMQCTTNYPSIIEDANLNVLKKFMEIPDVNVGYSDHIENNLACLASVSLGVKSIEKHITLDKNLDGPDHSCSLEFKEFKQLITEIRIIEKAMGSYVKKPSQAEIENSFGMKRSLFAEKKIRKGEIINSSMLAFKRPSSGLSPNHYNLILGKKAANEIQKDTMILLKDVLFD